MKDISNIFERIVELYTSYGYSSVNDFAINGLGYKASEKINRLKDPKNKPGIDIIVDISNKFEVETDWLLFGIGDMLKPNIGKMSHSKNETNSVTFSDETKTSSNVAQQVNRSLDKAGNVLNSQISVPLIPIDAMAGFGTGSIQVMDYDTERYVVPEFTELKVDFMIRVKGSSMDPKYHSGDLVACKKLYLSDIFFQWNKVYVLDTEQGALIKRLKKGSDNDHILIVSDNPKYDPFELHLSKINAIAIVLGVIRLE